VSNEQNVAPGKALEELLWFEQLLSHLSAHFGTTLQSKMKKLGITRQKDLPK
jgi:hypothetical protein